MTPRKVSGCPYDFYAKMGTVDYSQVGFQPNFQMTVAEVREQEASGAVIAFANPVSVEGEEQILWIDPIGNIWLADSENPIQDKERKIIS